MTISEIFGYIAAASSIVGLLPQVIKAYKTKSTDDVSMAMLINYCIGSVAWIVHGAYVGSYFVVWSNIFGGTVSLISVIQKMIYDNRPQAV